MRFKTFYVLKHVAVVSYLKSRDGTITLEVQQGLRCASRSDAEELKRHVKVPAAWEVVPVEYDTMTGRAREPVDAIRISPNQVGCGD